MNRLLVVEDDENTAEMLRRYFETLGYQVHNAMKGQDALRLAREEQPHVILMDIILPDIDGFETARLLRSQKSTDQIPIIFLTDKRDRGNRMDGLRLGGDDYMTKPFDIEELRLRVHNTARRVSGVSFVDVRTGLPSLPMVEAKLAEFLQAPDKHFAIITIKQFDEFSQLYSPVISNGIIRRIAGMIADLLHEIDPLQSFLGHLNGHTYLVAASQKTLTQIESKLPGRFSTAAERFYDALEVSAGQVVPTLTLDISQPDGDALNAQIATLKSQVSTSPSPVRAPDTPTVGDAVESLAQEDTTAPTYTCPACGFLTFSAAPGSADTCAICGWKDDLQQLQYPALKSGANDASLYDYQQPWAGDDLLDLQERDGFVRDPLWRPLRQEEGMLPDTETPLATTDDPALLPYYWIMG